MRLALTAWFSGMFRSALRACARGFEWQTPGDGGCGAGGERARVRTDSNIFRARDTSVGGVGVAVRERVGRRDGAAGLAARAPSCEGAAGISLARVSVLVRWISQMDSCPLHREWVLG